MAVSTQHIQMSRRDRALYTKLCEDRQQQYAAHIATMSGDRTRLDLWATEMTLRFGPVVRIHAHVVDWLTALMIVMYGEACSGADKTIRIYQYDENNEPVMDLDSEGSQYHVFKLSDAWPDKFTPAMDERAAAWANGKMLPGNIQYLQVG